jgi:alpha-ketoglutarate-dependent taurine dioxygenase
MVPMRPPLIEELSFRPYDDLALDIDRVVRSGRIGYVQAMDLTASDLIDLVTRIGPIFQPVALPSDKELTQITVVRESGRITSSANWHHDQSFSPRPPDWSVLYCVDPGELSVPTAFCDGAALLSYLSPGLINTLSSLDAEHLAYYPEMGQGPDDAIARQVHPVVRPVEGGLEALFVAPATVRAFCGWTEFDSRPLLDFLYRMMNWPEMTVMHYWSKGDLLVWPNRRYPHRALTLDAGGTRTLLRVVGHFD